MLGTALRNYKGITHKLILAVFVNKTAYFYSGYRIRGGLIYWRALMTGGSRREAPVFMAGWRCGCEPGSRPRAVESISGGGEENGGRGRPGIRIAQGCGVGGKRGGRCRPAASSRSRRVAYGADVASRQKKGRRTARSDGRQRRIPREYPRTHTTSGVFDGMRSRTPFTRTMMRSAVLSCCRRC